MFLTALLIVLLIAVVVAIVIAVRMPRDRHGRPNPAKPGAYLVAGGLLVVLIVSFLLSTFTVVSTRNIGVVTTFGKPVGNLGNGLHFTWPWQSVTEMDGAIQINWFRDDDGGEGRANAIVVRLGNNSNAWADTSIRWELRQEAAEELFLQYREFGNIQTNLVTRNLQSAMNEVFATYNPLATIDPADPAAPVTTPPAESQLPALAAEVTSKLKEKVGDQLIIHEVTIPTIAFDQNTQDRINDLNQQTAKTAIAEELERTNEATARANAALEESLSPEILTSKCLDVAREKNGEVFGCWPGTQAVPTIPVQPQG